MVTKSNFLIQRVQTEAKNCEIHRNSVALFLNKEKKLKTTDQPTALLNWMLPSSSKTAHCDAVYGVNYWLRPIRRYSLLAMIFNFVTHTRNTDNFTGITKPKSLATAARSAMPTSIHLPPFCQVIRSWSQLSSQVSGFVLRKSTVKTHGLTTDASPDVGCWLAYVNSRASRDSLSRGFVSSSSFSRSLWRQTWRPRAATYVDGNNDNDDDDVIETATQNDTQTHRQTDGRKENGNVPCARHAAVRTDSSIALTLDLSLVRSNATADATTMMPMMPLLLLLPPPTATIVVNVEDCLLVSSQSATYVTERPSVSVSWD